jgi:hypothetical protein
MRQPSPEQLTIAPLFGHRGRFGRAKPLQIAKILANQG